MFMKISAQMNDYDYCPGHSCTSNKFFKLYCVYCVNVKSRFMINYKF